MNIMNNIKNQLPNNFDIRHYLWLLVLVATVSISSIFSNIGFALGEVLADITRDGLILTAIIGLITAPFRKKWEWFHWLNMISFTTASTYIVFPYLIYNPIAAWMAIILVSIMIIVLPNFLHYYQTEHKTTKNIKSNSNSKSETTSNKSQRRFVIQDVKKEVVDKRNRKQDSSGYAQTKSAGKDDYIVKIKEAKALLDSGIISEEQFEKMKQKIIDNI